VSRVNRTRSANANGHRRRVSPKPLQQLNLKASFHCSTGYPLSPLSHMECLTPTSEYLSLPGLQTELGDHFDATGPTETPVWSPRSLPDTHPSMDALEPAPAPVKPASFFRRWRTLDRCGSPNSDCMLTRVIRCEFIPCFHRNGKPNDREVQGVDQTALLRMTGPDYLPDVPLRHVFLWRLRYPRDLLA
jgi:hypothetical protein